MLVLGLTGGFHYGSCDAAAALMRDGALLAAVEEERVSRVKHSFGIPPARCIKSVLDVARVSLNDVDVVVLYVDSYPDAVREMREHLQLLFRHSPRIETVGHHKTHAASSYYASGFDDAAVLNLDWAGDRTSTSIWKGTGGRLELVESIARPNSLGVFYTVFTHFLGFDRGDEYKVMGLASYGEPRYDLDRFLDLSGDTYRLNLDILNTRNRSLHQSVVGEALAGWRPELQRGRWDPITKEHMDLAASVQRYFERAVLSLARRAQRLTGARKLCIAGGGGLNCTANGRLVAEQIFDDVYVPPFPNDTGCAFGAAAVITHEAGSRVLPLTTSHWGPGYDDEAIAADLAQVKCSARRVDNVADVAADAVVAGQLVGWFQGRMEVGPRALGARSILADRRDAQVKNRINHYVKFREDFRPLAPSVLASEAARWFDFPGQSPFMSFTAPVRVPEALPGITHVDGTARLQTVRDGDGPYAELLAALHARTGYGCVLNTSFNYAGQPIVCTPKEAIYTFFGTGLDLLVLGHFVLDKSGRA